MRDFRSAPISPRRKALFAFLERVSADSSRIRRTDVDALRAEGWSAEAVFDAVTVCALFNFYNRWCDALGVHDMSDLGYLASGHRIATAGYNSSQP